MSENNKLNISKFNFNFEEQTKKCIVCNAHIYCSETQFDNTVCFDCYLTNQNQNSQSGNKKTK